MTPLQVGRVLALELKIVVVPRSVVYQDFVLEIEDEVFFILNSVAERQLLSLGPRPLALGPNLKPEV